MIVRFMRDLLNKTRSTVKVNLSTVNPVTSFSVNFMKERSTVKLNSTQLSRIRYIRVNIREMSVMETIISYIEMAMFSLLNSAMT